MEIRLISRVQHQGLVSNSILNYLVLTFESKALTEFYVEAAEFNDSLHEFMINFYGCERCGRIGDAMTDLSHLNEYR